MKYDGSNSYLLKMVVLTYFDSPRIQGDHILYIFNQKLINTFLLRRPFHDFDESSKLVKSFMINTHYTKKVITSANYKATDYWL